ncbi:MAG: glycosyltransferase [Candidatus Omnitrophica bacterium]|jgi:GT2 family glycosyltransferase|nr:glycosyltransferase [Candidatus Omnitrophota bacterium]
MTVSIIIAVAAYCENLKECVSNCLKLDYKAEDYEIIILPDLDHPQEKSLFSDNGRALTKIIPTGKVTPPRKRDIGAKFAKGDILAFLDDDAYPDKDWLRQAIKIFKEDDNIGCVCGPAVTALNDSIKQQASGLVYSSFLVSANHAFRYLPQKRREVFDFPSCNFLIRKELFNQIGGFDKPFWPGEDTFLCYKILTTAKKIVYDPKVLVYHHRRPLFLKHLRQIRNYAFHRGYFAKKYPQNSLQIEYFIPSLFVIWNLGGILFSLYYASYSNLYSFTLILYFSILLLSSISLFLRKKEPLVIKVKLLFFVIIGVFLTHLTYGIYFVKGLLAKKMPEE